ncbi:hypothetical protein PRJ39_06700 [Lysobacter enzymogenes]|uniref:PA domain-containing protein n=1 Tax=Lysobacter enzymogenes TaxID=69 RepID=UPI0037489F52
MSKCSLTCGIALALAFASQAHAARIVLVNEDTPGVGLNETTPTTPVGGNPGTTIGQQRVIAYTYAMDLWGALLKSDAEIRVQGSFAPLSCYLQPNGSPYIVLGQASGLGRVRGNQIPGAALAEAWYPISLANAIAGKDLDAGGDDIYTAFSSAIDQPECRAIGGPGWHYGLRGNADNRDGKSNFLNVIMHEIGHGLGVSGYGIPGVGTPWDYSARSNQFAKALPLIESYADLDKATTTPGDVVWAGPRANASAGLLAEHRLTLTATLPQQAVYDIAPAYFGPLDPAKFPRAAIVPVLDEAAPGQAPTSLACDGMYGKPKIANGEALRGKIALVDRGICRTGVQALAVQKYGAIGLISVSNEPGDPVTPSPGQVGSQVTIPVIGVSQAAGTALRARTAASAGLSRDTTRFFGLDTAKHLRLYTPALYAGGSTLSHVDTDMSPNALMEPRESATLMAHINVDVALDMFEDMGWPTTRGQTARLGNCDTTVPMVRDGFIPGANIIAHYKMCDRAFGGSNSKLRKCMTEQLQLLRDQDHISGRELGQTQKCIAKR